MATVISFTEYGSVVTGDQVSGVTVTVEPRVTTVSLTFGPVTFGTSYSTQEGSGSPVGSVTPEFKGQIYFDTLNQQLYVSSGLDNTNWIEVVRNY